MQCIAGAGFFWNPGDLLDRGCSPFTLRTEIPAVVSGSFTHYQPQGTVLDLVTFLLLVPFPL